VQELILKARGIPLDLQRLVFENKQLDSEKRLKDCNIAADSTIQLLMLVPPTDDITGKLGKQGKQGKKGKKGKKGVGDDDLSWPRTSILPRCLQGSDHRSTCRHTQDVRTARGRLPGSVAHICWYGLLLWPARRRP
jgi:hypothetical protein